MRLNCVVPWSAGILLSTCLLVWAEDASKPFTQAQKGWWAFQKPARPAVPAVRNTAWARTPVDAFLLAKLEERGIRPNPPADKVTLIRRAYLVLTGMPPEPDRVQAFLADESPRAFEKVVDELLASPHYGERWARHWLDLARYADSEGFKADETRPNAWRYRDYVIRAFNSDKPYTRFIEEQIAGGELFPDDPEALAASGFNRNFPDESNQANIMLRRQELLNDITDTTGAVFMGLTYGCARCHDHKYDPILHADYYRLQAFFANVKIDDGLQLESPERRAAFREQEQRWLNETAAIREEIAALLEPRQKARYKERLERFPEEIQQVLTMKPELRSPYQWQMYYKSLPQVTFTEAEVAALLKGVEKTRYKDLRGELARFDGLKPEPLAVAQGLVDAPSPAPATHILNGGAYNAPKAEVQPGFLTILDPEPAVIAPAPDGSSAGRRAALARWLARPDNPLTARVMANRIWHYQFGRGIAATPSDFGMMGERPVNKELLDYLAVRFVELGWSVKKLNREIMLSSAWQQSAAWRPEAGEADPGNRLTWRYPRHRLEGEAIRDSMLSVSGALNAGMYGPGVFPALPPGLETRGGWKENEDPAGANRRSIYIFVRRNTRYPMLQAFDMPDTHETCARRNVTVSSTQALEMLNSEVVMGWARQLAGRVRNDAGLDARGQVERAWRLVYQRPPEEAETAGALAFLERQTAAAGSFDAAFTDFCHMLINSNEFVYVN